LGVAEVGFEGAGALGEAGERGGGALAVGALEEAGGAEGRFLLLAIDAGGEVGPAGEAVGLAGLGQHYALAAVDGEEALLGSPEGLGGEAEVAVEAEAAFEGGLFALEGGGDAGEFGGALVVEGAG
jgi:hypothetical protein